MSSRSEPQPVGGGGVFYTRDRGRFWRSVAALTAAALLWSGAVTLTRVLLDAGHLPHLGAVGEWVWQPAVWLPNNLTWTKGSNIPFTEDYYSRPLDCLYGISAGFLFIIIRMIFNRYFAIPVSQRFRLSEEKLRPASVPALESLYRAARRPTGPDLHRACRDAGLSRQYADDWFKRRRNYDKPPVMVKFCESSFRCFFHVCDISLGLWILLRKPWYYDNTEYHTEINVWNELHVFEPDMVVYFLSSSGFIWSQLMSMFLDDIPRKDFRELCLHHLLTLGLINSGFALSDGRFGAMLGNMHDVSDVFLELSKSVAYLRAPRHLVQLPAFLAFVGSWAATRLAYYPCYLMPIFMLHRYHLIGGRLTLYDYLWDGCLLGLLALHLIWTTYILRIVADILTTGDGGDNREESDDEDVPQPAVAPAQATGGNKPANSAAAGYGGSHWSARLVGTNDSQHSAQLRSRK